MITPANSILTSSDCPNVMVACYDPNNTWVIQDGATISSQGWGASTTGTTILILGTLIINQNFDFYNCNISVYGGGQIIVNSGYTLKLDNTIIEGCYQMWQARWQSCRSGDNRFGIEIFASEYFVEEINRTGNRTRCQIESIADAMTGEKCRIANYCCLKILVGVF